MMGKDSLLRAPLLSAAAIVLSMTLVAACGTSPDALEETSSQGGSGGESATMGSGGEGGTTTGMSDLCKGNKCHEEATCTPNPDAGKDEPKYACSCNEGWTGNGLGCADIDECAEKTFECDPSRICVNTTGSYECQCPPGTVPDGDAACVRRFTSIALGQYNTCGTVEGGTMWCWGRGASGTNGTGNQNDQAWPAQTGKSDQWKTVIALGDDHACSVKDYGALWCWGRNSDGQLGINSNSGQTSPAVHDIDDDWDSVTTGRYHSCSIKPDGSLWCWGRNSEGQLGIGTASNTDERLPVQVGTDTDWASVHAGWNATCAIKTDNTLWCWGNNTEGEQANGESSGKVLVPTQIGTDTDWASVSPSRHVCALKTSGSLHCWGRNAYGQLGIDSTSEQQTVTDIAVGETFSHVATGMEHTCAIKTDKTLWCWGRNDFAQAGRLGEAPAKLPVQIGTDSDWAQIEAAEYHSCAIKTDGSLHCWGRNSWAQLGRGTYGAPRLPVATNQQWAIVAGNITHQCAIKTDGTLWCVGNNGYGRLGTGNSIPQQTHVQVGTEMNWADVAPGEYHTCAIKTDKTLWCWGYGNDRQLGQGNNQTKYDPQQVGTDTDWASVTSGERHSCAIKSDGSLWCWGENGKGDCGLGYKSNFSGTPKQVGSDTDWVKARSHHRHTCALKSDDSLWCWGEGQYGKLGNDASSDAYSPTMVTDGTEVADFDVGVHHSCALKTDGTLYCWGRNNTRQLGIGNNSANQLSPAKLQDTDWQSMAVGNYHGCATKTDSTLWCWGDGYWGSLGLGTTLDKNVPTQVGMDADWSKPIAYGGSTLVTKQGTLYAWGQNTDGQLGTDDAWFGPGPVLLAEVSP